MTTRSEKFEAKVAAQVNLTKNVIYEVFCNEGDLREYWGLDGNLDSPMMKKCYVPVYDGNILSISFEQSRAIRNLLDEAGVDTLDEL